MAKTNIKSKKGFTIIEVTLVLAIGGLIMMMVFLALPALQRAQRDTQRTDDVSRLITQLNQYQSNNRGKLPQTISTNESSKRLYVQMNEDYKMSDVLDKFTITKTSRLDNLSNLIAATSGVVIAAEAKDSEEKKEDVTNNQAWQKFYNEYLVGNGDTFEDPSGGPYNLMIATCDKNNGCRYQSPSKFDDQNFTLLLNLNATCSGDEATFSSGSRKVAVTYKKEGGGKICQNL